MPRELWAKLAVEIRTDPKLLVRQEWERLFWINLILLAKEKTDDGVLVGYTPEMLRILCAMRAKPTAIASALEYFQSAGMIELTPERITLVHFVKRQGRYDLEEEREKWRERKRRQRDKRDGSLNVTDGHGGTNGNVTNVPPLEESKKREDHPLKPPQGGATRSHPFRAFRRKADPPPPKTPEPEWRRCGASSAEEYEAWCEAWRKLPEEQRDSVTPYEAFANGAAHGT